jgi:hypothetical protein
VDARLLVVVGEVADPGGLGEVISSPVTALTTSGPVMNICEVSRTMNTKSVRAGL